MSSSKPAQGDNIPSVWVKALTQGGVVIKRLPRWCQFLIVVLALGIVGAYVLLPLLKKRADSGGQDQSMSISNNSAPVSAGTGINISGTTGPISIQQQPLSSQSPQSGDTLRDKSLILPNAYNGVHNGHDNSQIEYLAPFTRVLLNRSIGSDHFAFVSSICREVRYTRNASLHEWLCSVAHFCKSRPSCPSTLKHDLEDITNEATTSLRRIEADLLETFLVKVEEIADTHENPEHFLTAVLEAIQDEEKRLRQEYRHHKKFHQIFKRFVHKGGSSESFKRLVEDFEIVRLSKASIPIFKWEPIPDSSVWHKISTTNNVAWKEFPSSTKFTLKISSDNVSERFRDCSVGLNREITVCSHQLSDSALDNWIQDGKSYRWQVPFTPNQIATYGYESSGQMMLILDPSGNCTSYSYDAIGNRVATTHDALGRVISITYPSCKNSYTDDSLLTHKRQDQMVGFDESNITTYEYDANGRIICAKWPDKSGFTNQLFNYDSNDRLTSIIELNENGLTSFSFYLYSNDGALWTVVESQLDEKTGQPKLVTNRRPSTVSIGVNTLFNNVRLKYARNDALRVYVAMKKLQLDTLLLTDGIGSEEGLWQMLLQSGISLTDSSFAFFSGHGGITSNTERVFAISNDALLSERTLQKLAPKALIFADACSTPIVNGRYFSGSEDCEKKYESENLKGGVFTNVLLKALENISLNSFDADTKHSVLLQKIDRSR